ncbi:MAG: Aldose 1-epimerase [Devosia sp.]|nr:Aldose 1-epimerase [Devosia sp.]
MAVTVTEFGSYQGERVDQFRLSSDTGVEVDIIPFGVVVRDWRVPVAGGVRSVVLGFESFPPYLTDSPHFGALAGPVANRIAGASFELDGQRHDLRANEGKNSLHGGPDGLGRTLWQAEPDSGNTTVRFSYHAPDGTNGYPGNVDFTATYSLKGNRLRLELTGTTDKRTPINICQHQYFNLGTTPDVLDHSYQINANAYTELDAALIPTGVIRPVAGTPFDFRTPRTLRDTAGKPVPYDINLVLDQTRNPADPVATVKGPDGALTLKLWTDRPGVQLYDSVYTKVAVPGLGRRSYQHYSGFCLEDQSFPDSVHHPHFPSIIHSPEAPYSHFSQIEIA